MEGESIPLKESSPLGKFSEEMSLLGCTFTK